GWEEAFWAEVENDKTLLREVVKYFCDNAHTALLKRQQAATTPKKKRAARRRKAAMASAATEEAVRSVKKKVQIALLSLTMPNGKPLADCTGSECKRFGNWAAKLGDVVPAKVKVGDHLTEQQVRKLWRKA